jgi:hypothetical protein
MTEAEASASALGIPTYMTYLTYAVGYVLYMW